MGHKKHHDDYPQPVAQEPLVSEQALAEQRLREGMLKNLGPGWEQSTPGLEAIAQLRAKTGEIGQGLESGELTEEQALAQAKAEGEIMPGQGQVTELPVTPSVPQARLSNLSVLSRLRTSGSAPRFSVGRFNVTRI